jgi:lysophospholipase L1-like esterase
VRLALPWAALVAVVAAASCSRNAGNNGLVDSVVDGAADGAPGGPAGGESEAGLPGIRYVGRVDSSDPAAARMAWSGSGAIARFSGTEVGVKFMTGHQFTVVVDGAVRAPKLTPFAGTTSVATDLADGIHTIEIYRRAEANQGESVFLGFDFGAGRLLAPPPLPARRIEVIGDSITCGYGDEGADQTCTFSADTENHYLTYEAITARDLGADLVTVAWSGKGVVCNYGDDANSCVDPLPVFYDRTLPNRPSSAWNFSAWQPQVVVINLGTNDFSTAMDPSQADFEAGYKAFLAHIRSNYAGALILSTVAPLLTGGDLTTAKSYLADVVKQMNDAGDAKVKTFDMAPTDPADGYGCDYHPNLKTHAKMATQLTAEIKTDLGW